MKSKLKILDNYYDVIGCHNNYYIVNYNNDRLQVHKNIEYVIEDDTMEFIFNKKVYNDIKLKKLYIIDLSKHENYLTLETNIGKISPEFLSDQYIRKQKILQILS